MLSLNPYLVYQGTCEAAFNFYQQIFGGELLYIGRYKDVPPEARKFFPNAPDENIMHGVLKIGEKTVIMGNDSAEPGGSLITAFARDFFLYIDVDDPKEAVRIFNELASGGKILLPVTETFWSPCYGIVTDKFGIHWKITSHHSDGG